MSLLPSKWAIPARPEHLIERPRLSRRIHRARQAVLFALVAPAGYGKTMLALQVIARLPARAKAWYHIDRNDVDPRRFMQYLLTTLSVPLPALGESGLPQKLAVGAAEDEVLENLCFFLQEHAGRPIYLVLDNWEIVNSHKDIVGLISGLVRHAGGAVKIILNSRTRPTLHMAKLQESGQARIITQEDLAFSFPEFVRAVRKRIRRRIAARQLEEWWRLTAGWCVNLGLIIQLLETRGPDWGADLLAEMRSAKALNNYLEEELFDEIPASLGDFLARTAVLDVLSPKACRALIPQAAVVRRNLKALTESTIPHFPLSESGAYRLHPLIRQAALRHLHARSTPGERVAIYHAAADYYESKDAILEAIDLLCELPDHVAALEMIDRQWFKITQLNGLARVRQWLADFPTELHEEPLYIKTQATLLSRTGDNHALVEYLDRRLDPARFTRPEAPLLGSLWMHARFAQIYTSSEPKYDAYLREWQALKKSHGPFPPLTLAGIETVLGAAAAIDLRHQLAIRHMRRCLRYLGDASFDYRINTLNNIALFESERGHVSKARAMFAEHLRQCEERKAYATVPHILINMAEIQYNMGEMRALLQTLARVEQVMEQHQITNAQAEILSARLRGAALWFLGDREEGLRCTADSIARAEALGYSWQVVLGGLTLEYLHCLAGKPKQVVAPQDLPRKGTNSGVRLCHIGKEAHVAIVRTQWPRVRTLAKEILSFATRFDLAPWGITADFLLALVADRDGRIRTAQSRLRSGLEAMRRLKWPIYPMHSPTLSAFVYARATRWQILPKIAERLVTDAALCDPVPMLRQELQRRGPARELVHLLKAATSQHFPGLSREAADCASAPDRALARAGRTYLDMVAGEAPPALTVTTLGRFGIISRGQPVQFIRRRSRLLFQLLLTSHPHPIHEEVICEVLWPDGDPVKTLRGLQTCVSDLRRALDPYCGPRAPSHIEYDDGQYSLSLPEGSRVDALDLTSDLKRLLVRKVGSRGLTPRRLEQLGRALAHFTGDYLPEARYEAFAAEFRERLRQTYLDALLVYAQSLMQRQRLSVAIRALERGLAIDPLWSEGVEALMRARAENQELFRALRLYREYERRLRKELNLPPDRTLRRSFQRLLRVSSAGSGP